MILPVPIFKLMWRKKVIISTYKYDWNQTALFLDGGLSIKHLANCSISYHITEPLKPNPVNRDKTKISTVKSKWILHISRVNTQSHIMYIYVDSLVLAVMDHKCLNYNQNYIHYKVWSPEHCKCKVVQLLSSF